MTHIITYLTTRLQLNNDPPLELEQVPEGSQSNGSV